MGGVTQPAVFRCIRPLAPNNSLHGLHLVLSLSRGPLITLLTITSFKSTATICRQQEGILQMGPGSSLLIQGGEFVQYNYASSVHVCYDIDGVFILHPFCPSSAFDCDVFQSGGVASQNGFQTL